MRKIAGPSNAAGSAPVISRLDWLDTFKGLAILAVVAIHILSRFMGRCTPESPAWYAGALVSSTAQFAVPGFILLSALVNTGSLLRRPGLRRFLTTRLQSVLWPYILWSAIYIVYQNWRNPTAIHLEEIPHLFLVGRAYPHLYFLWDLLQLLIVLPFIVPIFRRRLPFRRVVLAAVALSALYRVCNGYYVYLYPNLGRSILQYIPQIALGLWLGSQRTRLPRWMGKGVTLALVLTIISAVLYFPLTIRADLLSQSVDTFLYQFGWWLYTSGATFLALFLSWKIGSKTGVSRMLQELGRYSLQIYLVHPLVLLEFDRVPAIDAILGPGGALALNFISALAFPLALSKLLERARISAPFFGR